MRKFQISALWAPVLAILLTLCLVLSAPVVRATEADPSDPPASGSEQTGTEAETGTETEPEGEPEGEGEAPDPGTETPARTRA